jgi:hypothetical protein
MFLHWGVAPRFKVNDCLFKFPYPNFLRSTKVKDQKLPSFHSLIQGYLISYVSTWFLTILRGKFPMYFLIYHSKSWIAMHSEQGYGWCQAYKHTKYIFYPKSTWNIFHMYITAPIFCKGCLEYPSWHLTPYITKMRKQRGLVGAWIVIAFFVGTSRKLFITSIRRCWIAFCIMNRYILYRIIKIH